MDARIRGGVQGCFAGMLAVALMLAPQLTQTCGAAPTSRSRSPRPSSAGGVTLRWLPPVSVSPGFTGYVIEAGASPGAPSVSLPLGNVLTYFVIAPNGRYYVRVKALFGATPGSVASNEIEVVVPPLPAAPTNVNATVERFTVNLTWNFGFGSATVTEWQVHAGSAPGLSDLAIVPLPSSRRVLTATVAAGTYYVRVVAMNQSGASPPSEEIVVTTGPNICDLPSTPTGFRAVAGQGGVLLVLGRLDGPSAHRVPPRRRVQLRRVRHRSFRPSAHYGLRLAGPAGKILREALRLQRLRAVTVHAGHRLHGHASRSTFIDWDVVRNGQQLLTAVPVDADHELSADAERRSHTGRRSAARAVDR